MRWRKPIEKNNDLGEGWRIRRCKRLLMKRRSRRRIKIYFARSCRQMKQMGLPCSTIEVMLARCPPCFSHFKEASLKVYSILEVPST